MSNLKKHIQLLFLLFAGLQMVCGPYTVVQVYAWGSMLASYSKESGLLQGMKDTFSGEKPCHICCKVAEAKKADSEKKSDIPVAPSSLAKAPEFVAASIHFLVAPSATTAPKITYAFPFFSEGIGAHSPPTPPPKRHV